MSDSLQPRICSLPGSSAHEILQARKWVSSHSLLQGIFLTQDSNPGLLHCWQILYHLSDQGSPMLCVALTLCNSPVHFHWFMICPSLHDASSVYVFSLLVYSQDLQHCLACKRCSINIHWKKRSSMFNIWFKSLMEYGPCSGECWEDRKFCCTP